MNRYPLTACSSSQNYKIPLGYRNRNIYFPELGSDQSNRTKPSNNDAVPVLERNVMVASEVGVQIDSNLPAIAVNWKEKQPHYDYIILISVGHNFTQGFSRLVFLFPENPGKAGTSNRSSQSSACHLFPLSLHASPLYTHFQIGFCRCSKSTCLPYVRRSRVTSPVVLLWWS